RQAGVAGPIFGERAETIGKGVFNLSASFSYVHLTTINGDSLENLLNQPRVNGQTLTFPVPHGITLADGRFTTFLPVHVTTDLDVNAESSRCGRDQRRCRRTPTRRPLPGRDGGTIVIFAAAGPGNFARRLQPGYYGRSRACKVRRGDSPERRARRVSRRRT